MTVASGGTPLNMVQNILLGTGVSVSNVSYVGNPNAIGQFNGSASNIGLSSGLILTTGSRALAPGPNNLVGATLNNGAAGDAALAALAGGASFDACVLEFDFVPAANFISFRYVFASEEYPEYVGGQFNDVFAFFLNGPGISGTQNIALLPSSSIPVSINTVNANTNATYYQANSSNSVQYDGFTTVLTASSVVQCGQTYHIKIAISDIGDALFESAVFLDAQSFSIPPLNIQISNTPTIDCNNDVPVNIVTSVSGGIPNYNYSWSSGQTSSSINVHPSSTSNYSLTVIDACGLTATAVTTVTVDKTLPNANAGADVELDCITTIGSFTASGGVTYDWTYPDGTSSGAMVGFDDTNTPGEYIVNVTGANGCSLEDTAVLSINQTPPNASAGADVVFNCSVNTGMFVATGGSTYSWVHPSGQITTNATINRILGDDVGDYTVTITAPNGCSVTDVATLIVDTVAPIASAGLDTLLTCSHMSINLNGTLSSSANAISYNWTTTGGNIVQDGTTTTPLIDEVGVYYITVLNTVNTCSNIDSVLVTIDTVSPISYAGIDTLVSCSIPVIDLLGAGSSVGDYSYGWTTADGNIVLDSFSLSPSVDAGGTYQLTVTNNYNGCSSTDDVLVAEDLTAIVDILSSSISVDDINGVVPFDVAYSWVGDNGTVVWDLGDNNSNTDSSFTHTYNLRGIYTVYLVLTDESGCVAMDSVLVNIDGRDIRFPNIFTPNGDGENDIFTFKAERMKSFDCSIYNRWGQLVYRWQTISGGWDGRTLAGVEASGGEYFYILQTVDDAGNKIEKKGVVVLKK